MEVLRHIHVNPHIYHRKQVQTSLVAADYFRSSINYHVMRPGQHLIIVTWRQVKID